MLPDRSGDRYAIVGIAVLSLLTLLYTVLIAGRPLLWFTIVIPLVSLYLAWRFVRAVERIAEVLERRSEVQVERLE